LGLVPIPLSGSHATSNPPLKRKLLWPWIANDYFATLPDQWLPLTTPLQYRRYVALKFAVAELTGKNSELKIHRHLASQSASHPGSERVLALLDHFTVQGVNGEHDVSVSQVIGPHLEAMFDDDPTVIQQTVKSLVHQVALGTSFLHHCGVVHAGRSATLSTEAEYKIDWYNLDLHKGNIAFEIPDLDGTSEEMCDDHLGRAAALCTSGYSRSAASDRFTSQISGLPRESGGPCEARRHACKDNRLGGRFVCDDLNCVVEH
jgi:hypothetical protein